MDLNDRTGNRTHHVIFFFIISCELCSVTVNNECMSARGWTKGTDSFDRRTDGRSNSRRIFFGLIGGQ